MRPACGPALSEPLDSTPDKLRESKGFTLVELLVVISIIAVLSVIGITVFTGVQKSARDAKRRGDIDAISKVMEVHYGESQVGMYSNLSPSYFSSGSIPQDPLEGQNKCGKHTDGTTTACQYCFLGDGDLDWKWRGQNEAHNGCGNPSNTVSSAGGHPRCGTPGTSLCPFYIICANLESVNSQMGSGYYCRFSQQ